MGNFLQCPPADPCSGISQPWMGGTALEPCSVRAHFLLLEFHHPLGISIAVCRHSPAYAQKISGSSSQEMPAQCWWTQRFTKLTLRALAQQQGSKILQNPGLAPCHLKVPRDMRSSSPHLAQLNTCSYHISGTIRWHSLCWEFLISQNNFGEGEIIAPMVDPKYSAIAGSEDLSERR